MNESIKFELFSEENMTVLKAFIEQNLTRKTEQKFREKKNDSVAVRLPKLEITKFDGNPLFWQTIIDSFEASVNSNQTLSKCETFNYLRSFLERDALHAVSGMSLTNQNYDKALDLMKERYGNTQLIISCHMNELLKLRRINSDNEVAKIRKFYDDIESNVRSLQKFGNR